MRYFTSVTCIFKGLPKCYPQFLEVLSTKKALVQRLHKVFPMLELSEILATSLLSVKLSQKC